MTAGYNSDIKSQLAKCDEDWVHALSAFGKKKSPKDEIPSEDMYQMARSFIRSERVNIRKMWERFTTDREELEDNTFSKIERAYTYLTGFHLSNTARMLALFERMEERSTRFSELTKGKHIHVFDIGCGTGACSVAAAQVLSRNYTRSMSFYLTDASSHFLDMSRFFIERNTKAASIKSQKTTIEDAPSMRFTPQKGLNIYFFGYVLNELSSSPKAKRKIETLLSEIASSSEPCLVVIAEPANEAQARAAMKHRDEIAGGGFDVVYPCTHSQSCPMTEHENGKNWCYSEFKIPKTRIQNKLDEEIEVKRTILGASAYIFGNKTFGWTPESGKVVVGKPRLSFGEEATLKLLLCDKNRIHDSSAMKLEKAPLRGKIYFKGKQHQS